MADKLEYIIDRYKENIASGLNMKSMLALVCKIYDSPYKEGLTFWTSMHDLCITQPRETTIYDGPHLRVSPKFNGEIEFRYIDTFVKDKQWYRVIPEEKAFERLESFFRQLGWFQGV